MSDPELPGNPLISDLSREADMRELVEQFVNELPARIADIQHTLADHDLATLRRLAHNLQGAAGSYGFPRISGQAAEITASLESHQDLMDITREIHELAQLCSRVRTAPASQ